jgi:hypothetical protein
MKAVGAWALAAVFVGLVLSYADLSSGVSKYGVFRHIEIGNTEAEVIDLLHKNGVRCEAEGITSQPGSGRPQCAFQDYSRSYRIGFDSVTGRVTLLSFEFNRSNHLLARIMRPRR